MLKLHAYKREGGTYGLTPMTQMDKRVLALAQPRKTIKFVDVAEFSQVLLDDLPGEADDMGEEDTQSDFDDYEEEEYDEDELLQPVVRVEGRANELLSEIVRLMRQLVQGQRRSNELLARMVQLP